MYTEICNEDAAIIKRRKVFAEDMADTGVIYEKI